MVGVTAILPMRSAAASSTGRGCLSCSGRRAERRGASGRPDDSAPIWQLHRLLFLIGTAVQGGKTGTFTMHYTDGSTSVVTQELSDWANDSSYPGEHVVRTMSYRNYSLNNGLQTLTMYAYGYSLPITPGKTLQSVTLPANADIKILSMDLVGPQSQVSLSSQFNQVGLTSDDDTNLGNLDGGGYSYSINALGGYAVAWAGTTFNLGSAGQNNVVSANNQTVVLPGGTYRCFSSWPAIFGPKSGTFTVNYSDGTSSTFTQSFSDWGVNSSEPGKASWSRWVIVTSIKTVATAGIREAFSFTGTASRWIRPRPC